MFGLLLGSLIAAGGPPVSRDDPRFGHGCMVAQQIFVAANLVRTDLSYVLPILTNGDPKYVSQQASSVRGLAVQVQGQAKLIHEAARDPIFFARGSATVDLGATRAALPALLASVDEENAAIMADEQTFESRPIPVEARHRYAMMNLRGLEAIAAYQAPFLDACSM